MNILMISSTVPYPPSRSGTEVRTFNLLKYLHQHHNITLVTQSYSELPSEYRAALAQYTEKLVVFSLRPDRGDRAGIEGFWGKVARLLQSSWKSAPPNVLHRYSPDMQAWIDDFVRGGNCDVLTCEHSVNTIYVRPDYRKYARTVVNVHSSVYWGTRNYLQTGASENAWRDRVYLSILYRYEKAYCDKFSRIVVTTPDDEKQLHLLQPDVPIDVIPNGVDLALFPYRSSDPGGHNLIFVGAMDLSHNIDAMRFFILQVFPLIRDRYPDATFTIAGNRPTEEVKQLGKQPGVIVTGRVPSMVEYLHKATICVIPLQTGFGIKNKTLEPMAAGVPVVGSDRGLEGLEIETAIPRALRANTISEYVNAIAQLFDNPELRAKIASEARSYIERDFTWEQAGSRYERALMG
ncbi:MAG: glycosyltransferase family 4 protein [Jaaginema sp. PMC 1079.18]|nr:glycosyltransferase family 4 protein [Jaaginema sp. PMC 1080.18]MEC4850730.1 glycosyltransferase family 4 protein [Jaaginema sp. PMC 1079.18]MEC4865282.1 glycosyltransferase family 4 protein [Jaaginema sp. PMC 1078.18]